MSLRKQWYVSTWSDGPNHLNKELRVCTLDDLAIIYNGNTVAYIEDQRHREFRLQQETEASDYRAASVVFTHAAFFTLGGLLATLMFWM